jgi:hypothetical protein
VRTLRLASDAVRVLAVPVLAVGLATGIAAVPATADMAPAPADSSGFSGVLSAVAAVSTRDAWAVGSSTSFKALTVHWNGRAWKQVPA